MKEGSGGMKDGRIRRKEVKEGKMGGQKLKEGRIKRNGGDRKKGKKKGRTEVRKEGRR